MEWEDYFIDKQQKAVALKVQIDQTDREIDAMVYELYGLTEEEVWIVKNSKQIIGDIKYVVLSI